jgi:hypothetical protein
MSQGKTINNSLHVISAMPPYQTKSFEEIRLEDYTGSAVTQPAASTSGFGSTFGATNNPNFSPAKSTFGAPQGGALATGGFGGNKGFMTANKPSGFGAGGFGQTQNQFQVRFRLNPTMTLSLFRNR